jgi:hypothetical protein
MAAVYNNYLTQAKKYYEEARKKAKEDQNKIFDEQVSVVNDTYNKAINDAKIDYEDMHRENAIQKLINENEVAEDMANMGLEGSGLNRTQATAVQLSYANNRSSIERQKQAQVDSIAQKLAQELSTIKQNRIATISAIDKEYDSAAVSAAQDAYKKALNAETARIKSYNSGGGGSNKLNKLAYGTLAGTSYGSNGNVIYTDSSGNTMTSREGTNPFSGQIHKDALNSDGEYDKSKVFSNGYQPNNYNGVPLKYYDMTPAKWRTDGKEQKVFTANGKYYVWYGPDGIYKEVEYDKQKGWIWA